MKKFWIIVTMLFLFFISGCSRKTTEWDGKSEVFAELFMQIDVRDMYVYVGTVDHVFVGTVEEIERNIISEKSRKHEDGYSIYQIHVDENLKGELIEEIVCYKLGGFRKDGTMLLAAAETPDGQMIIDSGLPETGKQYIFLAYAQKDGSLVLSEIFDNREYNEDLRKEYMDYVDNEIPFERERFKSSYAK